MLDAIIGRLDASGTALRRSTMDARMRELEPRELEAVVGGALYGAIATVFRLPGQPAAGDLGSTMSAGSLQPAPRQSRS
jgi:hypothetical protein